MGTETLVTALVSHQVQPPHQLAHTYPHGVTSEELTMGLNFRFLNLREVIELTSLSKTSIYRYMAEGSFPRNVSLGGRSVAWVSTEIEDWMRERMEARYESCAELR